MSKLANISDVRNVIRFESIDEIDVSIDSALEVATSSIETDLMTKSFDRETRFDIFLVKDREIAFNLFEYHWKLASGFVDSAETFTIRVADQISDFDVSGANTDITSEAITDFEKGVISIVSGQVSTIRLAENNSKIIGNFVRIDYTSGFNADDFEGFYDCDEVPSWLKEAAVMKAIAVLDTVDPTLRASEDNPMNPKGAQGIYFNSMEKNIRYFPKHEAPIIKS